MCVCVCVCVRACVLCVRARYSCTECPRSCFSSVLNAAGGVGPQFSGPSGLKFFSQPIKTCTHCVGCGVFALLPVKVLIKACLHTGRRELLIVGRSNRCIHYQLTLSVLFL